MSEIEKELSPQQRQIMDVAINGRLNKEIAEELNIHEDVVETQIRRVNKKLGTRSKFESSLIVLAEKASQGAAQEAAKNVTARIVASIRSLSME